MSTYYIAGGMTGYPNNNADAFRAAAAKLRDMGHTAVSPVEMDEAEGFDLSTVPDEQEYVRFLSRDIEQIAGRIARRELDGGVALDGWEDSRGAALEVRVIQSLGLPVYRFAADGSLEPATPPRHPSSEKFHRILRDLGHLHDRKQADYGSDSDPFANVRSANEWGLPEWVGAMVRATDKVRRLQSFARKGQLENESAEDAFLDLAVYAVIALVLYQDAGAEAPTS